MPWSKNKTVPALEDKSDTAIKLQALPATSFSPAVPSVLIHITQVN